MLTDVLISLDTQHHHLWGHSTQTFTCAGTHGPLAKLQVSPIPSHLYNNCQSFASGLLIRHGHSSYWHDLLQTHDPLWTHTCLCWWIPILVFQHSPEWRECPEHLSLSWEYSVVDMLDWTQLTLFSFRSRACNCCEISLWDWIVPFLAFAMKVAILTSCASGYAERKIQRRNWLYPATLEHSLLLVWW